MTKEGWGCLVLILVVGVFWGWHAFQTQYDGNRPLYAAVEAGDAVRVEALLDSGADPNSRSRGMTFLTEGWDAAGDFDEAVIVKAVYTGDEEVVRVLLRAGARPNVVTAEGHSILMTAAWNGQAAIVGDLLLKGAAPVPYDYDAPAAWAFDQAMAPEIRRMLDAAGFPSPFAVPAP